jgi:hypothetical protein
MSDEFSGWLWAVIDIVGGVIVLGALLFYGTSMWRRRPRDPVIDRVREQATEDLYQENQPDTRPQSSAGAGRR